MTHFTPRAQQALALARKEADRLRHNYVDTGHLLLGLIALKRGAVLEVLDRLGIDRGKLKDALEEAQTRATESDVSSEVAYTPRVKKILALAGKEAEELKHTYVGTEHIFLGLLRDGEGVAAGVLKSFGVSFEGARLMVTKELVGGVAEEVEEFPIKETVEADVSVAKSRSASSSKKQRQRVSQVPKEPTLATAAVSTSFVRGPAGYHSDYRHVGGSEKAEDYLDVDAQARRLAELIALRETKLPLAVGLFGNWGSGKSHFMSLMDQHIRQLAENEKKRRHRDTGPWCAEIVPIYFNAWHYLDANLWASLISEIFERLFAYLAPKPDELAEVQKLLLTAGGAVARADEELIHARVIAEEAKSQLEAAKAERGVAEEFITGLLDRLRDLIPQINTPENLKKISNLLDIDDAEAATLSQLARKTAELESLAGRVRELWHRATMRKGIAMRFGWLFGALVIVPAVTLIIAQLEPGVVLWLKQLGATVKAAIAGLAGIIGWMTPVWFEVQRRLSSLEKLQKQAEDAQVQRGQSPEVQQARAKVDVANSAILKAEVRLRDARLHEEDLKKRVKELSPQRRLGRFIEDRARSTEYRGQLGLVSLARRDFQELSDLFSNATALRQKQKGVSDQDAKQLEKISSTIDRIVLFVDDLDRCQPERVVDVLQAVHLLLAFPLFAVVVGVDQRCLKQSIEKEFEGLVAQANGAFEDEPPATSLDYLEKIFHIPFHLPAMNAATFGNFVEKLTEPATTNPTDDKIDEEASITSIDLDEIQAQAEHKLGSVLWQRQRRSSVEEVIGSVPLETWERTALKDYHPLIRTPRAATRLLNTYRLVRAGLPADEWDTFRGDEKTSGEFRVAMLLLAAAAGLPARAREWFARLRHVDPAALFLSDAGDDRDGGWQKFKSVFDATFVSGPQTLTTQLFSKWIDRVERFAF